MKGEEAGLVPASSFPRIPADIVAALQQPRACRAGCDVRPGAFALLLGPWSLVRLDGKCAKSGLRPTFFLHALVTEKKAAKQLLHEQDRAEEAHHRCGMPWNRVATPAIPHQSRVFASTAADRFVRDDCPFRRWCYVV